MTDELHTEEDARMDALEDRTRVLAARVEALTAERDALRVQVDCGQDGVCAVAPGCNRHWEARNRELAAQVEQMRGALGKSQREEKRLVRELIDLHLDDVRPPSTVEEAEAIMREAGVELDAFLQRAREHVARIRAALSPSPAPMTREQVDEALRRGVAGAREMGASLRGLSSAPSDLPLASPASGVAAKEPSDG